VLLSQKINGEKLDNGEEDVLYPAGKRGGNATPKFHKEKEKVLRSLPRRQRERSKFRRRVREGGGARRFPGA